MDLTVGGTELTQNGSVLTAYPGEQVWDQYAIDGSTWSISTGQSFPAGDSYGVYPSGVPLPSWQTGAAASLSFSFAGCACMRAPHGGDSTPAGPRWRELRIHRRL